MNSLKGVFIYLNIPWKFIKQRPQFIAENLNKYLDVKIYYNKAYKKIYITKDRIDKDINLVEKIKIPRKGNFLRYLDNKLQILFIKKHLLDREYIFIMHPEQYEILKNNICGKTIIYDCMDDYAQFPHLTTKDGTRIKRVEQELVQRADYIFYTSNTLQSKHKQRYGHIKNTFIVNNALEPGGVYEEDEIIKAYLSQIPHKKLVYIGAIAPWFDFENILKMLERQPDTSLVLFGPVDCQIPNHDRIHHYGKIPHHSIYTAMAYADCLIMPFKVNQLIEAVDPIKVYEYIASGKPVIVSDYAEMDKFKPFVETYSSGEQLSKLIEKPLQKCSRSQIDRFIGENTWEERAKQIVRILENEN